MGLENKMVNGCRKGQKEYFISFEKIKDLPSISGREFVCAKSEKTARNKFKRTILGRQKILSIKELK